MIDIWFVALMLIPSVEVILHAIGYLSRTKLRVYTSRQTQIGIRQHAKLQIGNMTLGYEKKPLAKQCWNDVFEDSRFKGIGHCLKKFTTISNIIMPIFFVVFLVTFISMGILLKHNLI